MNEVLTAVLICSVGLWAQLCVALQEELKNAFRLILTDVELEAKRAMVNGRGSLERGSANKDWDVAQCAAVLKNRQEKAKDASSMTAACINFLPVYEASLSSTLKFYVHKIEDVLFPHVLFVHSWFRENGTKSPFLINVLPEAGYKLLQTIFRWF